ASVGKGAPSSPPPVERGGGPPPGPAAVRRRVQARPRDERDSRSFNAGSADRPGRSTWAATACGLRHEPDGETGVRYGPPGAEGASNGAGVRRGTSTYVPWR